MQRKEKLIDKAGYESLCKQACDNLHGSQFAAKSEETVLFAICREVYDFFGEDFVLVPVRSEERLEVYWISLLELISTRQSEEFSVLEITDKYINDALNKRLNNGSINI